MNEAELREMMQAIERPVALTPEFSDRVFNRMAAELEGVAPEAPEPLRPRTPRLAWPLPLRSPSWRAVVAVAVAVALVVGTVTVLTVARAPSALAALNEARQRFEQVPPYHARTSVQANDDGRDPDLEATWATEDWHQDGVHWRTTVLASSSPGFGAPGDYRVLSPELYGQYDASADILTVRPSDELDDPSGPSVFFDPSLQWWSTGAPGDTGRPTDQFIEENCSVSDAMLIGRAVTTVHCDAKPRDIELWLDDETGLLLRVSTFEIVREITSLEISPQFPRGIFDVTAPEGATRRWDGRAAPPPEYRVALGAEVAARFPVADGRTDGLSIVQITTTDVWVVAVRCTDRCDADLVRVDRASGRVLATLTSPPETSFDDVKMVDGELWAAFSRSFDEDPTPASFVQRLDAASNQLVGAALEIGTAGGGMAGSEGILWSTSGVARAVTVGPSQSEYHALARVDVARGEATQLDLGADAIGTPLVVDGSIWVPTTKIRASDPDETDFELVQLDVQSQQVRQRVAVPGWPGSLTTDGRSIFTLYSDSAEQWHLVAIDVVTGQLSAVDVGDPGSMFGGMVVAGRHLWIASTAEGTVLKLDLATLTAAGAVATGADPVDVETFEGSVWVTNVGDGTLARIDLD